MITQAAPDYAGATGPPRLQEKGKLASEEIRKISNDSSLQSSQGWVHLM